MSEPAGASPRWTPLVYFWDGGWIGVGASAAGPPVAPHAHHAVQITVGLDGPVRFRHRDGEWIEMRGAVVLPDVLHGFDSLGRVCAMLFVDPESSEGRWLRDSIETPILEVGAASVAEHLPALLAFPRERPDATTAARIVTGLVRSLCAGPPPLTKMDPRMEKALEVIRRSGVRNLPLEDAARCVFLSPSRFAHLFKEEVGLPFRRYVLWRKRSRAMEEFGRGANLTHAAHAAGFSDSAHLTRTWRQMLGMSPTGMIGAARFYEIPAPFELGG
ncbi:MAG TPA: AraC family transcriptional regulator [Longimicrobiales bacterium]|nr:AraC family transcriptional regulator [Longimicrobiales bacterium]